MRQLSIIIPVYNERESLTELLCEIEDAVGRLVEPLACEVVFVDDGSTDGSWDVIEGLQSETVAIEAIRFRRNFGKAAALAAGFERACGELLITMDADRQDDPAEISRLVAAIDSGLDCVSGWKARRLDPWHKVYPSRVFNKMINRLTGLALHDHNCGLKAYRAEIFKEVKLYGELHRFVPVLAAARGFRVGEIVVHHRPRTAGRSKYGFERFAKGFIDLLSVYFLTSYRYRPGHLLIGSGLGILILGTFVMTVLAAGWMLTRLFDGWDDWHLHQTAIFYFAILAMLLGTQLISVGFLADLLTWLHRPSNTPFSVQDTRTSRPG